MSSYLLLRNNQETGPFTLEEMKGMSLKSYDLLWVVGKSAAWRYPGEIPELKPFAPPVPEQPSNPFVKKSSDSPPAAEPAPAKKTEPASQRSRESNSFRSSPGRSVYVNLPSERKQTNLNPEGDFVYETGGVFRNETEPAYDFSDIYQKQSTVIARASWRILWISTIALLFGAGILTGFFISDRRKFFSSVEKHPHLVPDVHPGMVSNKKENEKSHNQESRPVSEEVIVNKVYSQPVKPDVNDGIFNRGKKNLKSGGIKRDSTITPTASLVSLNLPDSLRQISVSKSEALYQKIKAHPDSYLSLVTGTYSTGIFGGISSFPVTITNNSPVMMDLVVVNIEYIQNNEKIFKSEDLSFTDLEPGETVSLKAPKSTRGIKIATRIHIVNIRQLDLSYSN
jgi:uncharacterized protein YneF (UPF0154 family)